MKNRKLFYNNKIRVVLLLLLFTCFLLSVAITVTAQTSIKVYVDNKVVLFPDQVPIIHEGRTLVPLRSSFEAMKAKLVWDSNRQIVIATANKGKEEITIKLKKDSSFLIKEIKRDGKVHTYIQEMDVQLKIIDGRAMIPLRAVGEALGFNVTWDPKRSSIFFSTSVEEYSYFARRDYPLLVKGDIFRLHDHEIKVYLLVNDVRKINNLKELVLNVDLSIIAREKSIDMQKKQYFDHHSPTYGSPFDMIKSFGILYKQAGENIAAGYKLPEEVMKGWMESPGHRENILRASFEEIGVGFYEKKDRYTMYWTQMFIAAP